MKRIVTAQKSGVFADAMSSPFKALWALLLAAVPVTLWGYEKEPDSGLVFTPSAYVAAEPLDPAVYHDVRTALLVHPRDLPDRKHHSNSNMATIAVHEIAAGGGARAHRVDTFREHVFIVLEGRVEFLVGGASLTANVHDVVYIPSTLERSFSASAGPARMLHAEWAQEGPPPETPGKAVVTSERLRPVAHTGGEGYVTVTPNPRQQVNPLSILAVGAGHINSSNSLLLYPEDITGARPFTANTKLVRMGLSMYHPEGGTRWHFHPDREQAFVILSGRGLVEIGANTIEAKAGDIIFAPRHVGHGYKTVGREPLKFFELEWGR